MTQEIIANLHIHSSYSDGAKLHTEIANIAADCGLNMILITDHNIHVQGFDGYHNHKGKKVLMITGEEIHDRNLFPPKNHLFAVGIQKSFTELASDSQNLINSIRTDGGLSFIAHAHDPAFPALGEEDLSWTNWSVSGFTGMEIWNNLSEFKIQSKNKAHAIFFALFPQFLAHQPPKEMINRWDTLTQNGNQVVGIGSSDAHTIIYQFGPLKKEIFPYRYHFKTINTHLIIEKDITGNACEDTKHILGALKEGNVFVANDQVKKASGFRFYAIQNGHYFPMGSQLSFQDGIVLQADLPFAGDCLLIRNGEQIVKRNATKSIHFSVSEGGVYRLECYRKHLFKKRGWIFSNPIYIL